jgi:hypothetical protein
MTEFSPVTITLFTSTVLIADVSELSLNTPIIAKDNCQPTLRTMVCPQWERRSAHHRRGDYGDRSVEGLGCRVLPPSLRWATLPASSA